MSAGVANDASIFFGFAGPSDQLAQTFVRLSHRTRGFVETTLPLGAQEDDVDVASVDQGADESPGRMPVDFVLVGKGGLGNAGEKRESNVDVASGLMGLVRREATRREGG